MMDIVGYSHLCAEECVSLYFRLLLIEGQNSERGKASRSVERSMSSGEFARTPAGRGI